MMPTFLHEPPIIVPMISVQSAPHLIKMVDEWAKLICYTKSTSRGKGPLVHLGAYRMNLVYLLIEGTNNTSRVSLGGCLG